MGDGCTTLAAHSLEEHMSNSIKVHLQPFSITKGPVFARENRDRKSRHVVVERTIDSFSVRLIE